MPIGGLIIVLLLVFQFNSVRRTAIILMTIPLGLIGVVVGLLPLWFGGGPMYEPMAITIIFGLLFATLLTLGVVPILYSVFFRVKFKGFAY